MESKLLKIKSRTIKNGFELIYITDNDSMFDLLESVKIKDLNFQIEVLQEITEGFQFKIRLTENLEMTDFFQFVITFIGFKDNKTFDFNFFKIIGNNESMIHYENIEIKYILFESDIDLNLKITKQ